MKVYLKLVALYKQSDGLPKTYSSIRVVDMLNKAFEALKRQFEITKNSEYIFLNQSRLPFYNHDVIAVNFNKILKKANVQARPLYNLRHTFLGVLKCINLFKILLKKMLLQ